MTNYPLILSGILAFAAEVLLAGCATSAPNAAASMPIFFNGARILFQGDSITDGNRGRSADPNHIMGHGYQFIIAAKYGGTLPDRRLVFLNRGVSGNTVSALARRWQADTIDLQPDILSILIGVNDLGSGVSARQYEQQYDELLSKTVKSLPRVKLILGEPFGLPVGGKKMIWDNYHSDLEERIAIVNKLGGKYHAPVVHYQKAFEEAVKRAPAEYWIWDGVHPTYSGHQLMADEWVRAVRTDGSGKTEVWSPLGKGFFAQRPPLGILNFDENLSSLMRVLLSAKSFVFSHLCETFLRIWERQTAFLIEKSDSYPAFQ